MKTVKHFLLVILSCMLIVGCGAGSKPSKVAETFLTAVQEKDEETLAEVYKGKLKDFASMTAWIDDMVAEYKLTKSQKKVISDIKDKMYDFDFEVAEEEISEDKTSAKVKVNLKTYKYGTLYTYIVQEYLKKMTDLKIKGASTKDRAKEFVSIIEDTFNNSGSKTKATTLTLKLVKEDKKWMVEKLSSARINRFKGGVQAAIDEFGVVFDQK